VWWTRLHVLWILRIRSRRTSQVDRRCQILGRQMRRNNACKVKSSFYYVFSLFLRGREEAVARPGLSKVGSTTAAQGKTKMRLLFMRDPKFGGRDCFPRIILGFTVAGTNYSRCCGLPVFLRHCHETVSFSNTIETGREDRIAPKHAGHFRQRYELPMFLKHDSPSLNMDLARPLLEIMILLSNICTMSPTRLGQFSPTIQSL
jgi:hypothetical protein